jgi:hypothetical protein
VGTPIDPRPAAGVRPTGASGVGTIGGEAGLPDQSFGLSGSPRLMGAGGLDSEKGEGPAPGAGAGAGAGNGSGGAEGRVAGVEGAGVVGAPDAGVETTAGDEGGAIGVPGANPIVGITPYAPGGAEGAEPQLPPTQGVGKSSQVSQWVHPVTPVAIATATSRRLTRSIPVSFPSRGRPCRVPATRIGAQADPGRGRRPLRRPGSVLFHDRQVGVRR